MTTPGTVPAATATTPHTAELGPCPHCGGSRTRCCEFGADTPHARVKLASVPPQKQYRTVWFAELEAMRPLLTWDAAERALLELMDSAATQRAAKTHKPAAAFKFRPPLALEDLLTDALRLVR